jgi:hypothetical protein
MKTLAAEPVAVDSELKVGHRPVHAAGAASVMVRARPRSRDEVMIPDRPCRIAGPRFSERSPRCVQRR